MKRGTPRHPKVGRLCEILSIDVPTAVGTLELLWHFTSEFAPQGDIGKYDDKRIEAALNSRFRPVGKLVEALLKAGWIEQDDISRLTVHDWHEHCDEYVRRRLVRAGLQFLSIREKLTGKRQHQVDLDSALPVPVPVPVPVPDTNTCSTDVERESVSGTKTAKQNEPFWGTAEKKKIFRERFWRVWPRRVAKAAAEKSWCKLASSPEVADRIVAAVKAHLPALTRDLQYCPYPATWLNEKRFEDDPEAYTSTGSSAANTADDRPKGVSAEAYSRYLGNPDRFTESGHPRNFDLWSEDEKRAWREQLAAREAA